MRSTRSSRCLATTVWAMRSATVGMPSVRIPSPCGFAISTATHRRRTVRARRHAVPDLVQIVLQVLLEVGDAASVHSRGALILLDLEPGIPDVPLGNIERLAR